MKRRSRVSLKHVAVVGTILLLVATFNLVHAFPVMGETSTGGDGFRLAAPLTLAWQWVMQRAALLPRGTPPPDRTPPSAPPNLMSTAPGPTIQARQRYINPTALTIHTMAPFDSSNGDLIIVCASTHAGVTMTPSDSFSNVWVSAAGPTNTGTGFDLRTQVWYAKNPTVGPEHILALNLSAPQSLVISLLVVKGSNIATPVDAISMIGDDGGSQALNVASPNITTTSTNNLLIGFVKSSVAEAFASGNGYMVEPSASSTFLGAESKLVIQPDTYNSTFTLNSPATSQAVIMAIEPSASVIASSSSQIDLSWTASTDNIGVTGYRVERCQSVGCSNFTQIATPTDTSFQDMGLMASTSYCYRVQATDAAGNLSGYSNITSATTKAPTPATRRNSTISSTNNPR